MAYSSRIAGDFGWTAVLQSIPSHTGVHANYWTVVLAAADGLHDTLFVLVERFSGLRF